MHRRQKPKSKKETKAYSDFIPRIIQQALPYPEWSAAEPALTCSDCWCGIFLCRILKIWCNSWFQIKLTCKQKHLTCNDAEKWLTLVNDEWLEIWKSVERAIMQILLLRSHLYNRFSEQWRKEVIWPFHCIVYLDAIIACQNECDSREHPFFCFMKRTIRDFNCHIDLKTRPYIFAHVDNVYSVKVWVPSKRFQMVLRLTRTGQF